MANRLVTSDAEIDAALKRASVLPPAPAAESAKYYPSADLILVYLTSGRRLAIPREEIQGLAGARRSDVSEIEVLSQGSGLHWPRLDVDLSVEGLLKGLYGTRRWIAEQASHRTRKSALRQTLRPRKAALRSS